MGWDTFGRTLLFAAVAAACWMPWLGLIVPFAGSAETRALYLVAVAAAYVAAIAPARGGVVALCLGLAGCAAAWLCTTAPSWHWFLPG